MAMKREVSFSTFVRAEPGRIFDAMATAEGLDSWFTTGNHHVEIFYGARRHLLIPHRVRSVLYYLVRQNGEHAVGRESPPLVLPPARP
jgi:uncharacterized protein YndB with AHSA1/START domain